MRKALALIPLIACLTACPKPIEIGPLPPPAERFVCLPLPQPPVLSALVASEANGVMVYRKDAVDARDGQIARYIVDVRGAWFDCSNAVQWHKDYWTGNE
jgi:hypothetical protein